MNNVIKLRTVLKARAKGKTLCHHGFHKWKSVTAKRFDVKQGKLVTVERCIRCNEERTRLL